MAAMMALARLILWRAGGGADCERLTPTKRSFPTLWVKEKRGIREGYSFLHVTAESMVGSPDGDREALGDMQQPVLGIPFYLTKNVFFRRYLNE